MVSSTKEERRKRGWPPTTGEYAAAIQELARQERKLLELRAEREVAELAMEAMRTRTSGPPTPTEELSDEIGRKVKKGKKEGDVSPDVESMSVHALQSRVRADVDMVVNVATKSSNFKGTYVRALKDARSIASVMEALAARIQSKEIQILEEDNSRLRRELETVKKEMGEMREAMGELRRGCWKYPSLSLDPSLSPSPHLISTT